MDKLLFAKLFSTIDVSDIERCWPWKQQRDKDGYGRINWKGKTEQVHRLVFREYNDLPALAAEIVIRHRCDNPPCCNPLHLEEGTHLDNMRDRDLRKGYDAVSMRRRTKLTEVQVRQIHKDSRSFAEIALDYGVAKYTIYDIKTGRSWKDVALEMGVTPPPSAYGPGRSKGLRFKDF